MRIRSLALSFMLLAAACGGTDAAISTTGAPSVPSSSAGSETTTVPSQQPASTEQPGATPTTAAPASAEGPIAPNFVTGLADGSKFDFGAHSKPVYLVFWAEW